jgi:hypothetical protein
LIDNDIYTIDPQGCKDIDDAISYDKENNRIGIHITDTDEIINNYTFNKYATIYAPHKTIPMFPDNISNIACSLLEKTPRHVISCWLYFENDDIIKIIFETNIISVTKNLSYEQADKLITTNNCLNIIYKKSLSIGIKLGIDVINTHKMVEVYMIIYNQEIAKYLSDCPKMIYRNQLKYKKAIYEYINKGHETLNLKYYTHATSPIRRYTDWIIQKIFKNKNVIIDDLDKINEFEINIKKLYRMWDYLKASTIIKSGTIYEIELIEILEEHLVFNCNVLNIKIYQKIKYDIINDKLIINHQEYKCGYIYEKQLYLIEDDKNILFFKIMIQF